MSIEMGFQPGDHIVVRIQKKGFLTPALHHGIYVGDNSVVHYHQLQDDDESAAKDDMIIKKVSLEDFSHGNEVYELHYQSPPILADEVVATAEEMCTKEGKTKYDLMSHNCEHIAFKCKTGEWASEQVEDMLDIAAMAVITGEKIGQTVGSSSTVPAKVGGKIIQKGGGKGAIILGVGVGVALWVMEGLKDILAQGEDNQADSIEIEWTDINGDGKREALVLLS